MRRGFSDLIVKKLCQRIMSLIFVQKMNYYHVYTKGLEDYVIFQEREDYVVGMNYVAVAAFRSGVSILAFVLMSNHFHFVVYANRSDAVRFICLYKQLISRYLFVKSK